MARTKIFDCWALVRDFFGYWVIQESSVEESPELLSAFDRQAVEYSRRGLGTTGAAMFWLLFMSWPSDLLVLGWGTQPFWWMAQWRVVIMLMSATACLTMRFVPPLARHPATTALVMFWLANAFSGYMASTTDLATGFYFGVYSTPVLTIPLVVPLRARFVLTFGLVGLYFTSAFLTNPVLLTGTTWAAPFVWSMGAALTSVVAGHIIFRLIRANFLQRRALDLRAQELEEMNRLKADFFANINHELRTPIANILGTLRTMSRQDLPDQLGQLVQGCTNTTARLLFLVNDLLELARFDSGVAVAQKQVVDVGAVVDQVAREFQTNAEVRLTVLAPAASQRMLACWDLRQVRTLLFNLLSNAFKFSPPGVAPVELTLVASEQEVEILVRDYGMGIAPDQLPRIFERFQQGARGQQAMGLGVGIGLALVKEIVDAHHGRIAVESVQGKGTVVRVHLPRGDCPPETRPVDLESMDLPPGVWPRGNAMAASHTEDPVGPEDGRRILVVEDNDELRAYLRSFLGQYYRVTSAANGREGLAKAQETIPELVLTDIAMPEMSGLELLEALRSDPRLATVPCVFLTALTGQTIRLESLRARVADFVQKPFNEEELLARIENLLHLHAFTRNLDLMVRQQTDELRRLASNLVSVQERERSRVARDIHDEAGQILTGLRIELERVHSLATGTATASREELETGFARAEELLAATHESVDRMINSLRPSILESRGFVSAITWLANETSKRHQVECTVEIGIDEEDLSPESSVALYRIVQEALTNIGRHSQARRAWMRLERTDENLVLEVRDDGIGFRVSDPAPSCFGILGIQERAHVLGGSCLVSSEPGQGTTVRVTVPELPHEVQS
jgi:signal transduction histidine kinase